MNDHRALMLAALLSLAGAGHALAAASQWEEVQGAAVRVVISDRPDADGRMRGALQIELQPGWKTYWIDPGDAGVPPSVALSVDGRPGAVEIGYPIPGRHDDGYSVWAGYDHPVSFALTIDAPAPAGGPLEFAVFLGVCETICIPLQATLTVQPGDAASSEHKAIVDGAFDSLPGEPRPGLRVVAARVEGEHVRIETEAPSGAAPELFLASTEARMFGAPAEPPQGDGRVFLVPLVTNDTAEPEQARYTLVSGEEAVSGVITIDP